jgi:hypothetical protein
MWHSKRKKEIATLSIWSNSSGGGEISDLDASISRRFSTSSCSSVWRPSWLFGGLSSPSPLLDLDMLLISGLLLFVPLVAAKSILGPKPCGVDDAEDVVVTGVFSL